MGRNFKIFNEGNKTFSEGYYDIDSILHFFEDFVLFISNTLPYPLDQEFNQNNRKRISWKFWEAVMHNKEHHGSISRELGELDNILKEWLIKDSEGIKIFTNYILEPVLCFLKEIKEESKNKENKVQVYLDEFKNMIDFNPFYIKYIEKNAKLSKDWMYLLIR